MTIDKGIVLQIGTFTRCPLCRESPGGKSPLVQIKEPYCNLDMCNITAVTSYRVQWGGTLD